MQYFMDCWPGGPEELKPWRRTNTTWCPDYGIYNQAPWHWIKAEKRPTWMYFCHDQQRHLSPHAFYRVRGWLVTGANAKTTQAQRKQIAELIIKLQGSGKN